MTEQITIDRAVVEQAVETLEAMTTLTSKRLRDKCPALLRQLRAALAEPQHGPVLCVGCEGHPQGDNNPCSVCGLAEPQQKHVGTVEVMGSYKGIPSLGCLISVDAQHRVNVGDRLYTAPQPAKREPLTDSQWQAIADTLDTFITREQKDEIETALGITGDKT